MWQLINHSNADCITFIENGCNLNCPLTAGEKYIALLGQWTKAAYIVKMFRTSVSKSK
jgi:hypothetical protein